MSGCRYPAGSALICVLTGLLALAGPAAAQGQDRYKSPQAEEWAAEPPPPPPAPPEPPAPPPEEQPAAEEAEADAAGEAQPAGGEGADAAEQEAAVEAEAEAEPEFLNRLIFTTGSFIVGGMGGGELGYDRAVSHYMTLEIDVSFLFWGFGEFKIFGIAGRLGTSIFFAGHAPTGWNLTISASAGAIFIDEEAAFLFDAQLLVGHKWAWANNVTFGVGVGVSYLYFHVDEDLTIGGAAPSVGFEFGYTW